MLNTDFITPIFENLQAIVERRLQLAIQACMDIAN
jgi:uncharacterized protein YutE (UPF0331/DUF86 family)